MSRVLEEWKKASTRYIFPLALLEVIRSKRCSQICAGLYAAAYEQIRFNMELLRPGMSFREFSVRSWRIPEIYLENRYSCIAHGIGMEDEYPSIAHQTGWGRIRRCVREWNDALSGKLHRCGGRQRRRETQATGFADREWLHAAFNVQIRNPLGMTRGLWGAA